MAIVKCNEYLENTLSFSYCRNCSKAFISKQNKIRKSKDKNEFDHEWYHALNEYYEFLIFNPASDELFVLVLAYD